MESFSLFIIPRHSVEVDFIVQQWQSILTALIYLLDNNKH